MRLPMKKKCGTAGSRRRGRPKVKKDGGLMKRKRNTFYRDFEFVPPPLPACITNQESLVFVFCKRLQKSDVSSLCRIVLPKRLAESHLPKLSDNENIMLPVIDMDDAGAWSFKFRYWPNNLSRMYVFEGTGPFTSKYRLQTGDYMLIYRDTSNWNYMIRGVKASEVEACANKEEAAIEGDNADNVVSNDADNVVSNDADNVVSNDADLGATDLSDDSANIPNTETVVGGTSSTSKDYSYFSDILNSFCSWDEIKDYYYTPTQTDVPSDNASSEDLSQV
ncbi:hypothetical protein QVD17_36547 [Tagetes erecta]|uniref:TF-B3 domain-containing protein n=1 Tax=Tagetes erecta TaxID=13708 RepID=A0AAD8JSJ5_TARER|nr:hypothetical protein QVD17_36547 [Tagetes erecta]